MSIVHNLPFEELKKVMGAANAMVIPSYSEGFCFVAVESMAMGVPVISSERKALKEVMGGKMVGMKEFSVKGLQEAMGAAIHGNWEERPEKRFELKTQVQAYVALYREMLKHQ